MPGLIGFSADLSDQDGMALVGKMAHALESDARFHVEAHCAKGRALGRVSLRILNPDPQPVWNEDQSLCLVMEGELYNYDAAQRRLADRGYRFRVNNDAEFALHLYEEYGEDFAAQLNGGFIIAIWDQRHDKIVIANDRCGLYPLYYAERGGSLVFASGVRALLSDPDLPRTVDLVTIGQFLTYDHALGDRTLLAAVRLLPPASLLTYQEHQLRVRSYWAPHYGSPYEYRSEAEWAEALLVCWRQAIERQTGGQRTAAVLLSGGLDSRVLLALLAERPRPFPLTTLTWGIRGCDDARFAKEASQRVGLKHAWIEFKPAILGRLAGEGVRLTDGLANITNLPALVLLEHPDGVAQIFYKGIMGDHMMGFMLNRQLWAEYDEAVSRQLQLQLYVDEGPAVFPPEAHPRLFSDGYHQAVQDAVIESYQASLAQAHARLLADQNNYFDLTERFRRLAICGAEVVRSRGAVRLPYCDNDLIDLSLRIPPGLRARRYLAIQVFSQAFPQLSKVPLAATGLPLRNCARDIAARTQQLARWHLRQHGLGRLAGPDRRPYRDYDGWFRGELRAWIEDTLLSARCLGRGYFRPDFIRRLVRDHLAGTNHSTRLGALMTLELWHQQFLD